MNAEGTAGCERLTYFDICDEDGNNKRVDKDTIRNSEGLSMDSVVVAVDVMGGDNAPHVVLEGIQQALERNAALEIIAVGDGDVVEPFAQAHERVHTVATSEVIAMDEHPAEAVRKKKDSSIVVGCRLVKEHEAQGFFSAGSTGACLAAATLGIGRAKGVKRPVLATVVPSPNRPIVFGDIGANADCRPEYLVQFASMLSVFASKMLGRENPHVALLNIGTEDTKGSMFAQEAFGLLRDQLQNFVGNCEGADIIKGTYDVVVTDGFTGNVCLKTIEGTAGVLLHEIKKIMTKSALTKLGALPLMSSLKELKEAIDPETYGGAPLLGLKGTVLIGHGSSTPRAIANGILTTSRMIEEDVAATIEKNFAD